MASIEALASLQAAAPHLLSVPVAASDDLLGLATEKVNALKTLVIGAGGLVSTAFLLITFAKTRAFAALLGAGITAAVFIWLIQNVNSDVKDRVDNEVSNGLKAPAAVVRVDASAAGTWSVLTGAAELR